MHTYWNNIRSMNRSNWGYIFAWSVISLAQFGFAAVLFNLYLLQLGFDKAQIGRVLATGSLVMALASLPAGYLGARITPRKAFEAGFLTLITAWVILLTAPFFQGAALNAGIMIGQSVLNIAFALVLVNAAPYFMQISTDANRIFIISFQQIIQGAMGFLGSVAAGVLPMILYRLSGDTLSEMSTYRIALVSIPILFVFGYLLVHGSPSVSPPAPKISTTTSAAPARFPAGTFAYFILVVLLFAAGWGGIGQFFNLYLHDLGYSTEQIGPLLAIGQVMPFLAAATVPLLNARMKIGTLFGVSALIMAISATFLSLNTLLVVIVTCLVFNGYTLTVINTIRSIYGQQLVEPRWRTYISAGNSIAIAVGFGIASLLGGTVIESSGFPPLFRLSAAALLACGGIMLAYGRVTAARASKTPAILAGSE